MSISTAVKSIAKKVLPGPMQGWIDYTFFYKKYENGCGGPLNGQTMRQGIYQELIKCIPFDSIVETGTFRATSTLYFRETSGLPIYTVELHPRFFNYSKRRVKEAEGIHLHQGDSRWFLAGPVKEKLGKNDVILFYLDAHWYDDLPLREEMNIICDHFPNAVILIDDFEVPGDSGYVYDDYGPGKQLTMNYLNDFRRKDWQLFFPANSKNETGVPLGCILITSRDDFASKMEGIPNLWKLQE